MSARELESLKAENRKLRAALVTSMSVAHAVKVLSERRGGHPLPELIATGLDESIATTHAALGL